MFSAKQKIYFTILIFAALLVVLSVFFLLPFLNNLKNVSHNIALSQATIGLLDAKIGNLADVKAKQALAEEYLTRVKSSFVDASAPVDFMNFLENEAQAAGLKIKTTASFSADDNKNKEQSFNADFQVIVGGAFNNCLRFLGKLEQGPWFLEVAGFAVQRIDEKTAPQKGFEGLIVGDVYCVYSLKTFSLAVLGL